MPKVGKKEFPYTDKGKKAAAAYAKKTGKTKFQKAAKGGKTLRGTRTVAQRG